MKKCVIISFCFMLVNLTAGPSVANESQVVAGAGPSTKIVQQFFADFASQPAAAGINFIVPEKSAKHAGGISCSDVNLFGRTGRPLNEKEQNLQKSEIFLAKVPIAFAVGAKTGIHSISLEDLEKIYSGQITNWKQIGGSDAGIVLAGREPTEALFLELKRSYGFFKDARFDFKFNKDNNVVDFLKSEKGDYALAFGAKPNFTGLNIIRVEGFTAGVRLGLVYDQRNSGHPVVLGVQKYAISRDWQTRVIEMGMILAR